MKRRGEIKTVSKVRSRTLWQDAWRRFRQNKAAISGAVIILTLVILAIGAPWIAPYHYAEGKIRENYAPPSAKHWLGCDFLGRDILSRLIYGTRVSLTIAVVSGVTSLVIGVTYGVVSGYFGGMVDNIMMRFVDIAWGFPTLLLIILMMVFFKSTFAHVEPGTFAGAVSAIDRAMGGMFFICIGIGLTSWLYIARLARGMVLSLRERDFVEAARAVGASGWRIIRKHLLGNILGPCIVQVMLQIPGFILYEAFLSFIGLGVDPPTPSWGMMIQEGYRAMRSHFYIIASPAAVLSITMLAFNFLGDGLRDALDPRSRL